VYRPLKEAIQTKGLASELERMVTAAYRDDAQTGNREKLLEEEQKYQEKIAKKRAKAQRKNEENISTYQRKAEQYNSMGLPEEALHEADRLLLCDPDSTFGHTQKSLAYHQQNNHEAALTECNIVEQASPGDARNLMIRAFAHQALGHDEAALADCARVEQLAPGRFAGTHLVTGLVYDGRGDEESAFQAFSRALSMAPQTGIPEKYVARLNGTPQNEEGE
ncbi:MAG: hypothetical protein IJS96_05090, partial [Schwartzia sp.]|nr:hypothetical protein [Schwartzia sp. (in: firmicutes)]